MTMLNGLVRQGFDPVALRDHTVDHSIVVPPHFLSRRRKLPIVPVYLNGMAAPRAFCGRTGPVRSPAGCAAEG
ncbi:hypothetical protein [Streptomyces sp. NPDC059455]|uniref:hypothetical protein n=1 Tax=Streptomyces sp. NPDC059455 TaxID=3346837 RepID=UPI0036C7A65B